MEFLAKETLQREKESSSGRRRGDEETQEFRFVVSRGLALRGLRKSKVSKAAAEPAQVQAE